MPLIDLHHIAIKAKDLDETTRFYAEVLKMRQVPRPPFDFPGAWLQMGYTMFHIYGGAAAKNPDGGFSEGGAAVDHIALRAWGFDEMKQGFAERGITCRENDLSDFGLWQLFIHDPNGVRIELNFDATQEPSGSHGPEGRGSKGRGPGGRGPGGRPPGGRGPGGRGPGGRAP